MTPSEMFKHLGAPLVNTRWSWGAIRASDGAVFLRVWQDRVMKHEGKRYVLVARTQDKDKAPERLGQQERLRHIAKIREGASCYMVMCLAEDKDAIPRKIKSFNKEDVFVGGELIELDSIVYIELADRVAVSAAREQKNA
jgi:hypothetical protein